MKLGQTRLATTVQVAQDRVKQMVDTAKERSAAGQIGRSPSTAVTSGQRPPLRVIGGNEYGS